MIWNYVIYRDNPLNHPIVNLNTLLIITMTALRLIGNCFKIIVFFIKRKGIYIQFLYSYSLYVIIEKWMKKFI